MMKKQRFRGTTGTALLFLLTICIGVRNISLITITTDETSTSSFIPEHTTTTTTSPICTSIFTLFRNDTTSSRTPAFLLSHHPPTPKQVWETLKHDLVQESIALINKVWNQTDNNNPNVAAGLHDMMNLLSPERLRKALVHPMPIADANKLVEIIRLRLEDPIQHPPLEIIAMGGSVVYGISAIGQTFGLHMPFKLRKSEQKQTEPAWANNLGQFINNGLFHGRDVVHVQNLALPGSTSDIGALLVDSGLFQTPGKVPDIVITAYSPNDYKLDFDRQWEVGNQLVRAIKTTRCDGLPIQISLVDPLDGGQDNTIQFLEQGQIQAMLTHWHDFMGLSFEKVLQDISIRDMPIAHRGKRRSHKGTYTRYWGNPWWQIHPGSIYHSAVCWLITISLANALIDSCEYQGSSSSTSLTTTDNTTTTTTVDTSAAWSLGHLPPLKRGVNYFDVYNDWNKTHLEQNVKCQSQRGGREAAAAADSGTLSSVSSSSIAKTCEYKWVHTKYLGVDSKHDVTALMQRVMIHNDGWYAEGDGDDPSATNGERPGWVTNATNSNFEIAISPKSDPITTVTIMYLKSYGPKWKDSAIHVKVSIVRRRTNGTTEDDDESSKNVSLMGIHDSMTSVNYAEKIQLSSAALPGDEVHATFQMIGGSSFRINGLLFCSS